jgi:DNA repair protein RecO (recombination protein O)
MKLYKTDAIIIRTRDYREADRLVTLFTRERGKVHAVAKGTRKLKSRKRGAIQLLTYGGFMLHEGRTLDTITQCEIINSFQDLRNDLDRLVYATYMAELTDGFLMDNEPDEEFFLLLVTALHLLSCLDPEVLTRAFELRLLANAGFRPELENCVACHRPRPAGQVRFSPALGGVLCPDCAAPDTGAVAVNPGDINVLKQLLQIDLRRLQVLKVSPPAKKLLARLMRAYIHCRLEKRVKSLDFLHSLTGTQ